MNKFIKKRILPRLAKRGFVLEDLIEREKIIQLIESLHPVKTQFDLIRLGPNEDGGYLVPDCLDDIDACFSPGVAWVSEFERDCLKRGMKIFMADNSVEKPDWDIPKEQYDFQKKHVGCTNNKHMMTMDSSVSYTHLTLPTILLV